MAVTSFGVWQGEHAVFGGVVDTPTTKYLGVVMLILIVLLLLHTSLYLLPLYSLAAVVAHFGTPEGMLQFAKEAHMRQDLVALLEEMGAAEVRSASCDELPAVTAAVGCFAQGSSRCSTDAAQMLHRCCTDARSRHLYTKQHVCM
jgi:hypothetical protein